MQPRFKAIYKNETIGWYHTEEEAIAALFARIDEEHAEEPAE